jgi:copper chaperone CopZ
MNSVTFRIEGMHCSGCAATMALLLQRSAGVQRASASFDTGEARVFYDPAAVAEEDLAAAIERAGYRVASRSPL